MTSHRMGERSACVLQDPSSSTDSVSVSVPQKLNGQCVSECPTKVQRAICQQVSHKSSKGNVSVSVLQFLSKDNMSVSMLQLLSKDNVSVSVLQLLSKDIVSVSMLQLLSKDTVSISVLQLLSKDTV